MFATLVLVLVCALPLCFATLNAPPGRARERVVLLSCALLLVLTSIPYERYVVVSVGGAHAAALAAEQQIGPLPTRRPDWLRPKPASRSPRLHIQMYKT